jgi:hypothetical protein
MRVVADRGTAARAACYEVQFPETGEILGYVTVSGASCADGLGDALRQNGLRLVPAELQQPTDQRTGFLP